MVLHLYPSAYCRRGHCSQTRFRTFHLPCLSSATPRLGWSKFTTDGSADTMAPRINIMPCEIVITGLVLSCRRHGLSGSVLLLSTGFGGCGKMEHVAVPREVSLDIGEQQKQLGRKSMLFHPGSTRTTSRYGSLNFTQLLKVVDLATSSMRTHHTLGNISSTRPLVSGYRIIACSMMRSRKLPKGMQG